MGVKEATFYAKNQPLNLFFDLQIGGWKEKYKGDDLFHVGFTASLSSNSTGTISIDLFDDLGYEVEMAILDYNKNVSINSDDITIQWGYNGNDGFDYVSPVYTILLKEITPTMGQNYFTFSIDADITSAAMGLYNKTQKKETAYGTVSEIIDKYMDTYDIFERKITPEFDIERMTKYANNGNKTTDPEEMKFEKLSNESDFAFLRRIINKYAIPQGPEGQAYEVRIDMDPETEEETIYITTPHSAENSGYTYQVHDPESVVLSFSPSMTYQSALLQGGGTLETRVDDSNSGDTKQTSVSQKNSPYKPIGGSKKLLIEPNQNSHLKTEKDAEIKTDGADGSEKQTEETSKSQVNPGKSKRQNYYETIARQAASAVNNFTANLEIIGDPKAPVGKKLDVIYKMPSSLNRGDACRSAYGYHWSSGTYFIMAVDHVMSAGNYTTTYQLSRHDFTTLGPTKPCYTSG